MITLWAISMLETDVNFPPPPDLPLSLRYVLSIKHELRNSKTVKRSEQESYILGLFVSVLTAPQNRCLSVSIHVTARKPPKAYGVKTRQKYYVIYVAPTCVSMGMKPLAWA